MNISARYLTVALMLMTSAFAANAQSPANEFYPLNRERLKENIKILSSDSFQGRRPFTVGETKTIHFIKNAFEKAGLQPGNGNSFFQDVPMVEITPKPAPSMNINSPQGNIELKNLQDYVIWTEDADSTSVSLNNDELVFAGFGVVAPEYNWNDYAGLDVKGKIVVVMVNDPGFTTNDTTLFKGKTMTYYGRWTYKYEEAARQGAKGCLIIHNTAAASYPFDVVRNSWGIKQMHLNETGNKNYKCEIEGWITEDAALKLLTAAGKTKDVFIDANKRGFKAFSLNETVSTSMTVHSEYNKSYNVAGKITGTKYPNEYVVYTAHWDHFGIGKPDEHGDSVYHGALDNASGVAALIELANAFASQKQKPERTVLFLAVTGEEQGLLGSEYYAEHPIYPLNKTVAELNMDVIKARDKTNDVVITGMGQSELEDIYINEAEKQGRYAAPEPEPEGGHYYRSDHFSFAKVGVPALDASGGIDVVGKGKDYGKKMQDDYTENHYHRPSDKYDSSWTFDGGLQDIQLLFRTGKRLAYSHIWLNWKNGSEFKAIREKSLKKNTN